MADASAIAVRRMYSSATAVGTPRLSHGVACEISDACTWVTLLWASAIARLTRATVATRPSQQRDCGRIDEPGAERRRHMRRGEAGMLHRHRVGDRNWSGNAALPCATSELCTAVTAACASAASVGARRFVRGDHTKLDQRIRRDAGVKALIAACVGGAAPGRWRSRLSTSAAVAMSAGATLVLSAGTISATHHGEAWPPQCPSAACDAWRP